MIASATGSSPKAGTRRRATVLMLLSNAYDPDPRVRQEALALVAAGTRVRLLAWDRDAKAAPAETIENVEVERVVVLSTHGRGTAQILFYVAVYLTMLWRGLKTRFDVVHCHDLDTLPLGFLLGKLKRKPIIYDAHESFPDMLTGSIPRFVQKGLFRLEDFLIRRIDLLITVGEKLRRHFEGRGARRSVTIGNWKRSEEYARTSEENLSVRRRLGIPDTAMAVACITQLLADRKLEDLLDAVDACADVHAIIGGRGVLEDYIRERAARNPRIHYIGFVPARDIPGYTCAADVIYYGFDPQNPNARFSAPNKLYEAVAAGRPLISGDFGEIADVVRDAECGIVLRQYSAGAVQDALEQMRDSRRRSVYAENAALYGRTAMNWAKGEEILAREYSSLLPAERAAVLPRARGEVSPSARRD